jgi:hypothetical protein
MVSRCSSISKLLEKYFDREATGEEKSLVERHLSDCPSCQKTLLAMEGVSDVLKTTVDKALNEETFPWVWEKIERGIRLERGISWWESFLSWLRLSPLSQKKIWVPLVAVTMLFLFIMPILFKKTPSLPASIVVEYVESQTSNVMVYELEKAKVTVIWLFEDPETKSST